MADLEALREAEALAALANEVAARIAAELRAMEEARQRARESLARIEATAARSIELLRRLGKEERRGRRFQGEVVGELAAGDRVRSALAGDGLAAALLDPPALATAAHLPAQPFRPSAVALPRFAAPRRGELEQVPLPASPREAGWDLLASEVRTFQDRYDEALARLDAAEREAAEARTKERDDEAPARLDTADVETRKQQRRRSSRKKAQDRERKRDEP